MARSIHPESLTYGDLIKAVRKHKGPVYAGMIGVHDIFHVQIVKADLIWRFKDYGKEYESELSYTVNDGVMYIDSNIYYEADLDD